MKNLLIRLAASGALAASMGVGLAHASSSIDDTGPHSFNRISSNSNSSESIRNTNTVNVNNSNHQTAQSGNASVCCNTWGGSARSGDAINSNQTSTNVSISNQAPSVKSWSGSGGNYSIDTTGPRSFNIISANSSSRFSESNTNVVNVNNSNSQYARSGNATVSGNTFGGDAISGNAENFNRTSTNVNIANRSGGDFGSWGNWGGGSYSISNTGPGSYNSINVGGGGHDWYSPNWYEKGTNDHDRSKLYNHNPCCAVGGDFYRKFDNRYDNGYGSFKHHDYYSYDFKRSDYHNFGYPCDDRYQVISYRTIRPPCHVAYHPVHVVHYVKKHHHNRCSYIECNNPCNNYCNNWCYSSCHHNYNGNNRCHYNNCHSNCYSSHNCYSNCHSSYHRCS